ncbi:MAG: fumarylacetoacetate hydrolase family protein [Hydrogenibacillus schlegelii]|nr:fumarylacetoacetate hydrolase family protein [Hydrogenibacillus schlegelii]
MTEAWTEVGGAARAVEHLRAAVLRRRPIPRLTETMALSLDQAYEIQKRLIEVDLAAGARRIGYKMGLTSPAKMKQMNVDVPAFGQLLDRMLLQDGASLRREELIHPRVELEVAVILGDGVDPNRVKTVDDVASRIRAMAVALEVIDSRYEGFRFTLPDVVADNASAARFVLGSAFVRPSKDVHLWGARLFKNGEAVGFGTPANVLGHPFAAVLALARLLAEHGFPPLAAGDVVLTGAIGEAVPVEAGDVVEGVLDHAGSVHLRLV